MEAGSETEAQSHYTARLKTNLGSWKIKVSMKLNFVFFEIILEAKNTTARDQRMSDRIHCKQL